MLEKNKDYVEFTLQYTSVDWERRSKDCPEVCLKGYSDFSFPGVPIMDVVCDEFDHKVVVVGKRDFEALQTDNEQLKKKLEEFSPIPEYKEFLMHLYSVEDAEKLEWVLRHVSGGMASTNEWIAISKFWKNNYAVLSELVGFSSVEEIQDHLTNEVECDTLHEAILKLIDENKYVCEEWCSANSSNNSWKAAAECNSPKELIEKLNLLRDDISGRSTVIESHKRDIEKWQKATGCLRPEDISTESLIAKAAQLDQEVKILNGALREWREGTGCPGPIAAKALIESGMAYEHGYHEAQEENRKLTEEVDSWKNVTGYSTPEDYTHARINNATPFDYTAAWQAVTGCSCPKDLSKKIVEWEKTLTPHMSARDLCSAMSNAIKSHKSSIEKWQKQTGCDTPDQVKSRIEGLENAIRLTNRNMIKEIESNIDEWQKFTGCDSPQKAGCKINNLCDEICKLKGDYDHLLELTGYKNEKGICAALVFSDENHLYITMRDLINSLKRKAKFTESNWQKATGCDTPGRAEEKLKYYKECVDNARYAAKCTKNYLDNITF